MHPMSTQSDPSYFPEWTLGWRIQRAMAHAEITTEDLAVAGVPIHPPDEHAAA